MTTRKEAAPAAVSSDLDSPPEADVTDELAQPAELPDEPATPAQDDASPTPAGDTPDGDQPTRVRLVPGDWTVDAAVFPYGEDDEGQPVIVTVTANRPGNVPYVVDDGEAATDVITAAARHGFALTKEPSA